MDFSLSPVNGFLTFPTVKHRPQCMRYFQECSWSCLAMYIGLKSPLFPLWWAANQKGRQADDVINPCIVQAFHAFCPKERRGDRTPLYSSFTLLYSLPLKLPFLYKALQRRQKARPYLCKHRQVLCRKKLTYSPKTTLHRKAFYRVEPCLASGNLAVGTVPFIP